ncbi:CAMK family protein kinase [Tritrichomonas foetus]|uniref:non-specific serine/threonine protein kinase n=1 Tax=Tritrichomonas foetus TaxID=1144522 RepID=A0A1J4JR82_9EUKA|nr:CAMK family protein kinase [Tritrichomonas foetus]|eukprot:OHT00928.1 CAMK family protein kinase [Tritrichomonas foetus]
MLSQTTIGNYQLIQLIGSGSFATVWFGRHIITGLNVAIKVIYKQSLSSPEASNRFNREVSLLKQMDHYFIAQLFEILETDDAFYLVMEHVENGDMLNFVNIQGHIDENRARRYFCQLISALNYLHNKKFIAHRDLKAENILLDRYDNIRLIDFGLSNGFSKISPELKTACGSPAYAAPEMIQGCPYTKAADVWSAGIVLYAMVAGILPFDDANVQTLLQKVVYTEVQYPQSMSRSLIDLLKRLLVKTPEKRLTIPQIIAHPWVSQSEYSALFDFDSSVSPDMVVDKEIVEKMRIMGLNVTNLPQCVMLGEFNPITSIYRQLRKQKLTEILKQTMINLSKSHQTIPHMPLRMPSPFSPMTKPNYYSNNINTSNMDPNNMNTNMNPSCNLNNNNNNNNLMNNNMNMNSISNDMCMNKNVNIEMKAIGNYDSYAPCDIQPMMMPPQTQCGDSLMMLAIRRSSLQNTPVNQPARRMSRPVVMKKPKGQNDPIFQQNQPHAIPQVPLSSRL